MWHLIFSIAGTLNIIDIREKQKRRPAMGDSFRKDGQIYKVENVVMSDDYTVAYVYVKHLNKKKKKLQLIDY